MSPLIPSSDEELMLALRTELETQSKQAGALIQNAQQNAAYSKLFITAIDQSSESIFFTDEEGKIIYANKAFETISGYSKDEITGRNPKFLKSGEHPHEFYKTMWETLLDGKVFRDRVKNKTKSGEIFEVELSISPVKDEQGIITHFVAIATDLKEILSKQDELESSVNALEKANQELEQFVYAASHDLQEPLRTITSCLQLAKKRAGGEINERAQTFMDHAITGAKRMRNLIDDLLALSRISSHTGTQKEVHLESIVEIACDNLAASIAESDTEIDIKALPTVIAFPGLLTQLFQNIIGNAIKFRGEESPKIEIGCTELQTGWRIHVQDNGIGISPEHLPIIFKMFQRLHSKEEYPGTGIGLAICKKIVEKHGGSIGAESLPAHGTTIHFTIPK